MDAADAWLMPLRRRVTLMMPCQHAAAERAFQD